MTDSGARQLAAAVCVQAIKDYEQLCKLLTRGKIIEADNGIILPGPTFHRQYNGKKYIGDSIPKCSFAEIEAFFLENGEMWVNTAPEISVNYLLKRKRAAMRSAKRRK